MSNLTQCLLFDLDGTLIDSRDVITNAVYSTLEQFLPGRFNREDILKRFGESFDELYNTTKPFLRSTITKEQLLATYFEFLQKSNTNEVRTFSNVHEGLLLLRRLGYRLGIVTNKQRNLTLQNLKDARLGHLFDTVVTIDDVKQGKPSPLPIIKAMVDLNVKPCETIMVGDSIFDLEAARAANVECAILESYGRMNWNVPEPDYIFANFKQLITKLLKTQQFVS